MPARDERRALLKQRVQQRDALLVPGAGNALTARVIADAGFEACYVTGAGIANTHLGAPDIGLVTLSEVAATVAAIAEISPLPLILDIDTGFGNAINVMQTVKAFERAGASAIQLEDQMMPKRCGHLAGKTLVNTREMIGKLHAAQDARSDDATLIVARTDAIAVEGFDSALERAERYAEARIVPDHGPLGQVLETGVPLVTDYAGLDGSTWLIAIPVLDGDRCRAVVTLVS